MGCVLFGGVGKHGKRGGNLSKFRNLQISEGCGISGSPSEIRWIFGMDFFHPKLLEPHIKMEG